MYHFFPLLAFIMAAIACTDIIMMSIITTATTLTTTNAIVKIQLVCINPFMAASQSDGSEGQGFRDSQRGLRVSFRRQAQP